MKPRRRLTDSRVRASRVARPLRQRVIRGANRYPRHKASATVRAPPSAYRLTRGCLPGRRVSHRHRRALGPRPGGSADWHAGDTSTFRADPNQRDHRAVPYVRVRAQGDRARRKTGSTARHHSGCAVSRHHRARDAEPPGALEALAAHAENTQSCRVVDRAPARMIVAERAAARRAHDGPGRCQHAAAAGVSGVPSRLAEVETASRVRPVDRLSRAGVARPAGGPRRRPL
jgi:hypothetical protein